MDGGLLVNPAPPYLLKYLRYSHRSFKTKNWQKVNDFQERLLYVTDDHGGLITLPGFFDQICSLVHKNLDNYQILDYRTAMPPVDWQRVKQIGPRPYQVNDTVEFLTKGMQSSGICYATGGYGKTFLQAMTYAAWNNLNTILAIPLKEVMNQTYKKFVKLFPDKHVGRMGDGYKDISSDITVTTFRSLESCAIEKCQMLLVDELQSSTGDRIQEVMSQVKPIRVFGYTATDRGLFNGADKLLKGLFGERLIYVPYQEAEEVGAVVPGIVYMVRTPDIIISAGSMEGRISQGIKRCTPRNELVGKVCAAVPNKWQTIVFVDHVMDHLIELNKLMPPGTKFIHRESSKKKAGAFALSKKQQDQTVAEFVANEFQYLIATDAFRAGVDVPNCRVVVQASGGSSEIEILQEAYRGSRTLPEERRAELGVDEKTHFVLIDFQDNHDEALMSMADKRRDFYLKQGWTVRDVDSIEEINWFGSAPKTL